MLFKHFNGNLIKTLMREFLNFYFKNVPEKVFFSKQKLHKCSQNISSVDQHKLLQENFSISVNENILYKIFQGRESFTEGL
jgi:hypothetical protein